MLVFSSYTSSTSYPDTACTTTTQNFDISGRFSDLNAAGKLVKINSTNYTGNVFTASATSVWTNGSFTLNRAHAYGNSVVGESAGGASIHMLMTSPLAQELFHRAVIMSGERAIEWARPRSQISNGSAKCSPPVTASTQTILKR